ncbi:MAG TPA: hypothetical protein VE650_06965 [Acetobacteraceae bacterium]|nr:hypothetical protein [Acetobacteraceae bacterium]
MSGGDVAAAAGPAVPDPATYLRWPTLAEKLTPRVVLGVACYLALAAVLLFAMPNTLVDVVDEHVVVTIGLVGLWRFSWWGTHVVRALIFRRIAYPRMRLAADDVWRAGVRPSRLHVMMTTFRERPEITTAVIRSILGEARSTRLGITIWLGSGDAIDEDLISTLLGG